VSEAAATAGLAALAARVREGDRRALAQAITLVESTRADHRADAGRLLDALLPETGRALRVAITGTPGAGKSTLIEALGRHVLDAGRTLAVLAIDPSSRRSGGSVLGDKTRMEELARDGRAFIRPSPSGGTLGGVARRTGEVLSLCEAAGFDTVLVETVGVGQSEVAAADLVDVLVLVTAPAGGDELQGIKRGIIELADVIAVNKADGELVSAARHSAADLRRSVGLLRPKWPGWDVPVLLVSARDGTAVGELWSTVVDLHDRLAAGDALARLRADQRRRALHNELTERLLDHVRQDHELAATLERLEREVEAGSTSVTSAVERIVAAL
jgi:LAO/AO transport system kinase